MSERSTLTPKGMSTLRLVEPLPEQKFSNELPIISSRQVALSALQSFSTIGFHATTTRDISDKAEVSVGSLYTYFTSKEGILYFWLLEGHRDALRATRDAYVSADTPGERVHQIVRELTIWHLTYPTLSRLTSEQFRALNQNHLEVILELRRQIVTFLRMAVEAGHHTGEVTHEDTDMLLNAIFAMILDVSRWYSPDGTLTRSEIGERYALFVHSMLLKR